MCEYLNLFYTPCSQIVDYRDMPFTTKLIPKQKQNVCLPFIATQLYSVSNSHNNTTNNS